MTRPPDIGDPDTPPPRPDVGDPDVAGDLIALTTAVFSQYYDAADLMLDRLRHVPGDFVAGEAVGIIAYLVGLMLHPDHAEREHLVELWATIATELAQ